MHIFIILIIGWLQEYMCQYRYAHVCVCVCVCVYYIYTYIGRKAVTNLDSVLKAEIVFYQQRSV